MFLGVVMAIIWMLSMGPGFPEKEDLTELEVVEMAYLHLFGSRAKLVVSDSAGAKYRLSVGAIDEDDLKRLVGSGGQWTIWYRLMPSVLYKDSGGIYQIEIDGVMVLSLEETKRIFEGRASVFDMWFLWSVSALLFLNVLYRCLMQHG